MSLDVYLHGGDIQRKEKSVFYRSDGQTKEMTLDEWNKIHPNTTPSYVDAYETDCVYTSNITHNLGKMANESGLYECMWCPYENGLTTAQHLIAPLEKGLEKLISDPEKFKSFNPDNGWGTYEGLVTFVSEYLDACRRYPHAKVSVSK